MSKSDLTINPTGNARGRMTGRNLLLVMLAAMVTMVAFVSLPSVANANVGLGASSGNRSGDLATPVDFGSTAQANLPKQVTIWLYNDNNTFLNAQSSTNVFTITGSGFRRNGGTCNGTATGTSWTSTISGTSGITGSGNSCSIILEIQSGTAVGAKTGTITFTSDRTIESGTGNRALQGNVTEENGNVIRVYDPNNGETNYDFGGVAVGDSSTRTFTLKNTGTTAVAGANRALSGSAAYSITGTTCGATLAVLGSCTVDVKYQPTIVGTDTGTLSFTSSSGHSDSIGLTAQAFSPVADLAVTPMTYDYGTAASTYPASKAFTVSNTGNTTLNLSFAQTGLTDPAVFYRSGGTCGATLAVGNSCTMIVKFDPAVAGAALQTGTFDVTGSTPLVGSPAVKSVSVQGTRVAAVANIEPRNTANTTPLTSRDFGTVAIGSTGSYTFSIANTGNVPVPSITPSLSGPEASQYSITGNTCGSQIERDTACTVTVTVTPTFAAQRRATLTLTPAAAALTASPKTVSLTTTVSGIRIKNDVSDNFGSTAKRWLDTPSLGVAGTAAGDIVRVAFDIELPADSSIAGVDIVGSTTNNDTAPSSGYQNITDLLSGKVTVERKPGSHEALVRAEVPLNSTNMGTSLGNYGLSTGTDLLLACTGGTFENSDRRVWFRIRGSNGETSATVGSIVRFHSQLYACPYTQGPWLSNQKIVEVGGVAQPNNTIEANANKNQQVEFQFNTKTYAKGAIYPGSDGSVDAMDWRIRNSRTGDMYRWDGSQYIACADPCTVTSSTNRYVFPEGSAQGVKNFTLPAGIPSRGRWVVEASPQGSDENDASYFELGVLKVNDHSGASPTISKGGTLGLRPNTNQAYTISATVADPSDPVTTWDSEGGRAQVIEWDLDGNTTNGPGGDGFEVRSMGASNGGLPSQDLTQTFDTTGKTPGPYTIRARVVDNGAFMSDDNAAESKIMTYTTTINSPAEAVAATHTFESDDSQPKSIPFTATDVDSDAYRVDITPDGSNDGSLAGNLHDVIGANSKDYTWPATFTGSDTFDFVATDDHNGQGAHKTLTIRINPNTQIDSSTISGLLHPDLGNPVTRFLGSTTATSASFTFSSLQNPVTEMECKLTNDGNIVEDWTNCGNSSSGSVSYSGLADGLHKVEVRAVNAEGDRDGTPAFRTWRVDNTAPEVETYQAPPSDLPNQQPRFINDNTPAFKFRATSTERSLQQYMTYECRVMWGPVAGTWYPCGSPSDTNSSALVTIVNGTPDFGFSDPLADGTYEIQVRGTDELGNLGPAMSEQFTVDTVDPETALASGPEGLINTRNVEFVLGSSQGQSTFYCELEGTNTGVIFAHALCPGSAADGSRPAFNGLADDTYTLTAAAHDPAQNVDPTPLVVNFEVDATEPTTTLDPNHDFGGGPTAADRTQSRKVDLTFSGNDTRQLTGFQCRIDSTDDSAWQICSSVQRFSGLSDGAHQVEIRAKDQAGNVDSSPSVFEWTIDNTPPVTSIDNQPATVSNDATPSIEFSANEAISGSVCSVDGGAEAPCTSPLVLSGLDDGNHTVTVRSTDIAGNVELTVASATWRQDTVVPEVTFTSKPPTYMPIGDADFAWSVKDGNPLVLAPEVEAQCALDPVDPDNVDNSEWQACDRDMTIAEVDNTNGAHVLEVRATDEAGNVSPVARHDWTVLGSKPVPVVVDDSSPAAGATTRVGTAFLAFHHELDGTGALDGLFCSLDGGTQTRCDGNYSAEGLADGSHTFSVVAKDIAGNISDPTTVSWDVQRGAPVTSINSGPDGLTKLKTASFQFSSNKDDSFECKLDGGAWEACTNPVSLGDLAEGQHTFAVRAVSSVAPVGVKDPTPPSRTWTVDSVAPDVAIDSAPQGQVVSYEGDVTFHSTDPDAGFQCKVGSRLYDDCSSPWHVTGLTAGDQTVTVRAVDAAGNVSGTPATASWTVLDPTCGNDFDGTPPNCTEKPAVTGPGIHAVSTGGTLSLATLGAVDLPAEQVKLDGKIGSDGRWFVPADGVTFAPVTQVIEDVLGPGTSVTVTISINATGNGWGVLTNGGGVARMKLPVKADVDAKLGDISLFPSGSCYLSPVTFNLVGTWDEGAMTAHLEQGDVAFPTLTGCGTFKETVDTLLELPRNDIQMALDLALTKDPETCPDGQVGTPPDCSEPTPVVKIEKPVLTGTKTIKSGKKATYSVTVSNSGDTAATSVKVCLSTPKKFIKGKAKRCKTVATVAAGGNAVAKFNLKAKKFKLSKAKKLKLRATASYTDGSGAAKTTAAGLYTAKAGKTGKTK